MASQEEPVSVLLYRHDGMVTSAVCDAEEGISLDGISYIKLVGNHQLDCMEIIGDFRVTWE